MRMLASSICMVALAAGWSSVVLPATGQEASGGAVDREDSHGIATAATSGALDQPHPEESAQGRATPRALSFLPDSYPDQARILRGDVDPYEAFEPVPESWASRPGMFAEADTLKAFGHMREAAARDGVDLVILSAFRSFQHQRSIWDQKWLERETGEAAVGPHDRAVDIMRYSSMPGTSRHHWGTDLDLNALTNDWFDTLKGKRVYDWMKTHAADYGFCEVYSARAGRRLTGYEPERWHWSYIPTASRYLAAYVDETGTELAGFEGEMAAHEIDWLDDYVLGINPDCLWKASDIGRGRPLPPPLLAAALEATGPAGAARAETVETCPPEGWTRAQMVRWKDSEFPYDPPEAAGGYALMLAGCLGDPDPALRDEIAYTGISQLLRSADVGEADLRTLRAMLLDRISPEAIDPEGFSRPFAALALSEVARTDRISPWMSDAERTELVSVATAYLRSVRDYRGYVDGEGWRHGIAHGADLLMQLSLNPEIGHEAGKDIAAAVLDAISREDAPAFVFDEPRRLARPLLHLVDRGLLTEAELTPLFKVAADPAPLQTWADAFRSEQALARRHNLKAFGYVLLTAVNSASGSSLSGLEPGATHILATLP
jgi:hypothetical protein